MKERVKHILLIILVVLIIDGAIALLLNNISYNPSFSVIDVLSGATKKTYSNEANESFSYSKEDVALTEDHYKEEKIRKQKHIYTVLENTSAKKKDSILLLSNKENKEYQRAMKDIKEYLEDQGYNVEIKECSEMMMLSLIHEDDFDLFLMSEEEIQ